ncbi:MAG: phospho-N-acetylmuramoyl-pentapeptide-transferase, partial [Oscillospiraceae bacterium]|nr:phospho-N-acetylmuramoyl-pentapeptide-transferase [Oscillospiraceae bacterium]
VVFLSGYGYEIMVPFVGPVNSGWFFIVFTTLLMLAMSNSSNLTDGLDGLLAGIAVVVFVFFCAAISYVPELRDIYEAGLAKVFSALMAGGCLGFLAFNLSPARVWMGDTGSLAIGGAISSIAVMVRMPFILLIVGLPFIVESLSVIIQVASFKLRGKRVFKMAPLHHHFEEVGMKETTIVYGAWVAEILLCAAAFPLAGYFAGAA